MSTHTKRELRSAARRRGATARRSAALGLVATAALALTACGGDNIRKELGLIGQGPDEFTVVKRKPLTMPEGDPAAADLPTPQPGAPNLVDPRPFDEAQAALQGSTIGNREQPSDAESAFLQAAGASGADDGVREQIAVENDRPRRLLDGLIGTSEERGATLDPAEEADRLAREAQAGKNPDLEIPEPADD